MLKSIPALIVAALGLTASPAAAATGSSSVTGTITIAPPVVRSVTVSPTTINYTSCWNADGTSASGGLPIPNGSCATQNGPTGSTPITVTNGQAAGHIDVNAGPAMPADNGTAWQLCGNVTTCAGPASLPGTDQYQLIALPAGNTSAEPALTATPACDNAFDETGGAPAAGCAAGAGQTATEWLKLVGPAATTDPSGTFTTTVTWTAVP